MDTYTIHALVEGFYEDNGVDYTPKFWLDDVDLLCGGDIGVDYEVLATVLDTLVFTQKIDKEKVLKHFIDNSLNLEDDYVIISPELIRIKCYQRDITTKIDIHKTTDGNDILITQESPINLKSSSFIEHTKSPEDEVLNSEILSKRCRKYSQELKELRTYLDIKIEDYSKLEQYNKRLLDVINRLKSQIIELGGTIE